jgi:D-alanyl-lipoteichoic acid acyltransferase DltB (MBOAT superfamily)
MYFNTTQYILFLPLVVILFYLTPFRFRWLLLLAASYYFYVCWRAEFMVVIIFSTMVNYFSAILIARNKTNKRNKKIFLTIALVINLGMLIILKYLGFINDFFHEIFGIIPAPTSPLLYLIAPVGLSYFTLQSLTYVFDTYYNLREPEKHPGIFALYVAFFPLILSGPIEQSTHLLPQFRDKARAKLKSVNIEEGIKLIIWGYFLKLVVADRTSIYVDAVFGNVDRHGGITFIAALILYSFQIYSDFAGYSCIAIGSARLMGFDVLHNFNRPYFSQSISEFWTRWHISLSTWLRNYLFNPLSYYFMRKLQKERYLKIIKPELLTYAIAASITFLMCGIWHGANFTFIIWGSLHGFYLIVDRIINKKGGNRVLNIIITYILVLFAWIFFRSENVHQSLTVIKAILTHPGSLYIPFDSDVVAPVYAVLGIFILLMVEVKREFFNNSFSLSGNKNEYIRMASYGFMIFLILYLGVFDASQFMYVKF